MTESESNQKEKSSAGDSPPSGPVIAVPATEWNRTTRDDVIALYRLTLGRAPESEQKIVNQLATGPTLAALRERLFSSPEFMRINRQALAKETIGRAFRMQQGRIEADVAPDILDLLFKHVEQVWTSLGNAEPHYSVLSAGKYKPDNIQKNEVEFNASGDAEWKFMSNRLAALGIDIDNKGTIIELGCGVGRVSRALAASFAHFIGYDISLPHLEIAQKYFAQEGVTNFKLEHLNSISDIKFPEHDFFYSRIVLQHNPPPVQKFLLNTALSSLRPNGIALFQVVTALEGYTFLTSEYLEKMGSFDNQELHVLPQKDVFEVVHANGCVPIEVVRDVGVNGFDRVSSVFTVRKHIS